MPGLLKKAYGGTILNSFIDNPPFPGVTRYRYISRRESDSYPERQLKTVEIVFFVLLFGGPPRLDYRSPIASLKGQLDAYSLFQIALWGIAGLWVLYHTFWQYRNIRGLPELPIPHKFGVALIVVLSIGIFISPAPAFTAYKVFQVAVMMLGALWIVRHHGISATFRLLLIADFSYCAVAAIATVLAPNRMLINWNSLGITQLHGDLVVLGFAQMTACGVILLLSLPNKSIHLGVRLFGTLLLGGLLILTASRSAYLCVAVFCLLTLLVMPRSALTRVGAMGISISAISLSVSPLAGDVSPWILRNTDSLSTLDGRLGLWRYLVHVVFQRSPLIGTGFCAGAREYSLRYASWSGSAHSAFVEALVGGGVAGFVLVIALWLVLGCYALMLVKMRSAFGFAACALLVAVLIASNVGEGLQASPIGMTFWMLVAIIPTLYREGCCEVTFVTMSHAGRPRTNLQTP